MRGSEQGDPHSQGLQIGFSLRKVVRVGSSRMSSVGSV